ncbi:MAG: hypothetical protein AAGJ18_00260 [Bacteroidota bacterium]
MQLNYDKIFAWCVQLLVDWAAMLGMTYNEINVWIFVIIHPIILLVLVTMVFYYRRKYQKLLENSQK